jgi:hypothetical protein
MKGGFKMIVTFQSKASGDVIMFGDVAHNMMRVMGKEPTAQGIVTVEQLATAIAQLKVAIDQDKQAGRATTEETRPQYEDAADGGKRPYVGFSQRAVPLLELLERSLKDRVPVVWGV